jgi:nitrite reductase (NADH) large subunit
MKRALIIALLLLALFAASLHWRHQPIRTERGLNVANLIGNVFTWIDAVVVTALFLRRRTAALGFLLNGILVIYGSVLMLRFNALMPPGTRPSGLYGWLVASTAPDLAVAWADFLVGAALWMVYVREGQTLLARGVARRSLPRIRGEHLVIVGSGVAGVSAAEAARQRGPNLAITLLGDERELPYRRLRLTPYMAGQETRESLLLRPRQWYRDQRINVVIDAYVTRIQPETHTLLVRGATEPMRYDRLILATGAYPRRLAVPGFDRRNVWVVRQIADADGILRSLRERDACVVVGGGLLGLETAKALALAGGLVQVVERAPRILPRQLDERGSARLADALRKEGLGLHTGTSVAAVEGEDRAARVVLTNGVELFADLVVVAAGIESQTRLAAAAGCHVQRGIVVDDRLATTVPDVYAAGDCAEHRATVYGMWPAAMEQGRVAGLQAAGGDGRFTGVVPFNLLKVVETPVYSVGLISAQQATDRELVLDRPDSYTKLTVRDGRLVGAVLVGDTKRSEVLTAAIVDRFDVARAATSGDAQAVLDALLVVPPP